MGNCDISSDYSKLWGLRNGMYNMGDALGCTVNNMVYRQASSIPNPAKKNELFKKWAAVLKVEHFLKSTYKFSYSDIVCSEHFTEDDYRVPGGPITRRFGIVLHFVAKPRMFCNDGDLRICSQQYQELSFHNSVFWQARNRGRYSRRVTNFSEWLTLEFSYSFYGTPLCIIFITFELL